jgi:hypothetical protein
VVELPLNDRGKARHQVQRQRDLDTPNAVQEWIDRVGARIAYITPGSPWENGFIESFMCGPRVMPRKSYKPEEIVAKLRQVDVLTRKVPQLGNRLRAITVKAPGWSDAHE